MSYEVQTTSLPGPASLEGREELNVYDDFDSEVLRCYQEFTLASNIFACLLDSQASEQSSRMSAMENATKNAGALAWWRRQGLCSPRRPLRRIFISS